MTDRDSPARSAGRTVARKRQINRWNEKRKQTFLVVLSETANVSRAARRVRMSLPSAYDLKKRDPAFARGWAEALEIGFCELELSLLRQAREGSERVERVEIGEERKLKYVKIIRSHPNRIAMGLLAAHRVEVTAYRVERAQQANDADLDARLRARMDLVRARLLGEEAGLGSDPAEQGTDHDG